MYKMNELRYRIIIMEYQDQEVIREIQEMDNGLMQLGEIGTMQVLLKEWLKLLKLGIQPLGIRWLSTITAMENVIWLMYVLNLDSEEVNFISRHYF